MASENDDSQVRVVLKAAKAKQKTSSLEAQKKKEKLGQGTSSEAAKSSAPPVSKVIPGATKSELEAAGALAGMKAKKSTRKSRVGKVFDDDGDVALDVD